MTNTHTITGHWDDTDTTTETVTADFYLIRESGALVFYNCLPDPVLGCSRVTPTNSYGNGAWETIR